jgi:plasmid replication initiation protein
MYEIVMMELKNNHRKTFEYDLDYLQSTIFDTTYNNFANFKLRVLDKASKDIFEKADLILNYEPAKKKGKRS